MNMNGIDDEIAALPLFQKLVEYHDKDKRFIISKVINMFLDYDREKGNNNYFFDTLINEIHSAEMLIEEFGEDAREKMDGVVKYGIKARKFNKNTGKNIFITGLKCRNLLKIVLEAERECRLKYPIRTVLSVGDRCVFLSGYSLIGRVNVMVTRRTEFSSPDRLFRSASQNRMFAITDIDESKADFKEFIKNGRIYFSHSYDSGSEDVGAVGVFYAKNVRHIEKFSGKFRYSKKNLKELK